MTTTIDTAVTAGATGFALPPDFKDVYDLRVISSGRGRTLTGIPRRLYDRIVQDQTGLSGELAGYDLFNHGANGIISITPPPAQGETVSLKYYRRMWVPCAVTANIFATGGGAVAYASAALGALAGVTNSSPVYAAGAGWVLSSTPATAYLTSPTTITLSGANMTAAANTTASMSFGGDTVALDIPEDFENGILSWATHHFLSGLGAPQGRLGYFIGLAESEFDEARAANERYEDQDIAFEVGNPTRAYNARYY